MNKILGFLNIKKIGFLEVLLALYPIVAGYQYGSISMNFIWLLIIDVFAIARKQGFLQNRLLFILFLFVIIHEILVWIIGGFRSTHFNYNIVLIVMLLSVFIISPALQFDRLEGSIFLVGYISCIGIIYHASLMLSGQLITPIPLPFLPKPDISSRLFEEGNRPCSFFWEPASYVTYMMIPLFVSLVKKKWILVVFFVFCIFLSTSTNGIIMAPVMVAVYVLMGKQKFFSRIIGVVAMLGLVYFLFNSELFVTGIEKLQDTEYDTNVRTSNGPWLVSQMPVEHIVLGIPTHTVEEYASLGNVSMDRIYAYHSFYMSDFWRVLATYGIFGLILHLMVFFHFGRRDRLLWPYIVVLFVAQFSQSVAFKYIYVFQICFIICFLKNQLNIKLYESADNNNLVCQ